MPTRARRGRRRGPRLLPSLVLVLALALPVVALAAPRVLPVVGNGVAARLADPAIDESSGLTASPTEPGAFWTLNDSGDGPVLYAIDGTGAALGRWLVTGAENRDWEDLAAGFDADGAPVLWIADTGDNANDRADAALYRLPEPPIERDAPAAGWPTLPATRFPIAFPDGPRDAEAMLVHPFTGEVVLVAKAVGAADAYRVRPREGDIALAERVGAVRAPGWGPFAQATGGAVSPDGTRIALRSYGGLAEWDIAPGQTLADALMGEPRQIPVPFMWQAEAVAYGPDGRTLFLTAEGSPGALVALPSGS